MTRRSALLLALLIAVLLPLRPSPALAADAYWTEPAYPEFPLKGAPAAVGLVIWNHGLKGNEGQYKYPPPLVIAGLAARGWDVIKLNRNPLWENGWSNAGSAMSTGSSRRSRQRAPRAMPRSSWPANPTAAPLRSPRPGGRRLWGVIAAAPGIGQATILGNPTDFWTDSIVRATDDELQEVRPTRLALVFPKDMSSSASRAARVPRHSRQAGTIPFLLVDEEAPIRGHVAAYSKEFGAYATCIGHFLDPMTEPKLGEFRCHHDEVARVIQSIRAIQPEAVRPGGASWFGYFGTAGQELILTFRDESTPNPTVEYAWAAARWGASSRAP